MQSSLSTPTAANPASWSTRRRRRSTSSRGSSSTCAMEICSRSRSKRIGSRSPACRLRSPATSATTAVDSSSTPRSPRADAWSTASRCRHPTCSSPGWIASATRRQIPAPVEPINAAALSPDGRRAAASIWGASRTERIEVIDLERGVRTEIPIGGGSGAPKIAWSPDGERIAASTAVGGGGSRSIPLDADAPQRSRSC